MTLLEYESYDELAPQLELLKRNAEIVYGAKNEMLQPELCYVFVIDPDTRATIAVLAPDSEGYQNVVTGQLIKDISIFGENKSGIWVQPLSE